MTCMSCLCMYMTSLPVSLMTQLNYIVLCLTNQMMAAQIWMSRDLYLCSLQIWLNMIATHCCFCNSEHKLCQRWLAQLFRWLLGRQDKTSCPVTNGLRQSVRRHETSILPLTNESLSRGISLERRKKQETLHNSTPRAFRFLAKVLYSFPPDVWLFPLSLYQLYEQQNLPFGPCPQNAFNENVF